MNGNQGFGGGPGGPGPAGFGGGGSGGTLLFRYIPQNQMLGKADLNRMSQAADKFTRSDIRTLVRLFVLQGFLKDDKKPATPTGPGPASNNSNF